METEEEVSVQQNLVRLVYLIKHLTPRRRALASGSLTPLIHTERRGEMLHARKIQNSDLGMETDCSVFHYFRQLV
jgi:hypothetical protein